MSSLTTLSTSSNKPEAFIFDVDGTLADVEPYRHHVMNGNRDFDSFHRESVNAHPHYHVVNMALMAKQRGYDILVVTARMAKWRNSTAMWLAMHNIPSDALFMRGDEDHRKDYLVKKDILTQIQKTWDVVHAVDDNPSVIALWKENGIKTTTIPGFVTE